jgi:hypothetical protein
MPELDRRLDRKLRTIKEGRYSPAEFVLADAKDADMGFGGTGAGPITGAPDGALGPGRYGTRDSYLDDMRSQIAQGDIDILLASASNGERLAADGSLGDDVTLAVRGNDATDIWVGRGATYDTRPSLPFRSADLEAIRPFCDLVLYSITFNNDLDSDRATLLAYGEFRRQAAAIGMRHFLEVFNPNAPAGLEPGAVPAFVNDSIVRSLAGVTTAHRPVFLKVAYNGADALAELTQFDPSLVVGILGGSAGTTRDTFELLHRAESSGARVALFGRKIQHAESQLDLVRLLRAVLGGELSPTEAVRSYHATLAEGGVTARRSLEVDLELTDPVMLAE